MSDKIEEKPVLGYEEFYKVDFSGNVTGISRIVHVIGNNREYEKRIPSKTLKQGTHSKGYKVISLTVRGKSTTKFVHRIVAEAFIPNPDNLPFVNHKDEDKTNNRAENLEWCDPSYNRIYGNAIENHARKIRNIPLNENHKQKISEGLKQHYEKIGERREPEGKTDGD